MNTPSHAILNLFAIDRAFSLTPALRWAAIGGGILPDLPIFGFYIWAKFAARLPESKIWSEAYYWPVTQAIVAVFHSIPIAVFLLAIATWQRWPVVQVLCLSCILHDLGDLPLHNSDAHRHFFPLSDWRFISPVSYWNPQHYGAIAAAVEFGMVAIASLVLGGRGVSAIGAIALVAVNLLYGVGYVRFYLRL